MKLHFITSISKEYWEKTGRLCIPTWDLPGKVTIYVEQKSGTIDWMKEIPFPVELLHVPTLKLDDEFVDRRKVLRFWGKTCAQITAVRNREENERIIWIDADVEQISPIPAREFQMKFDFPFAIMNSKNNEDCWETGLVIFNQDYPKLGIIMKRYEQAWKDEDILLNLWKPYDAQVLGYIATEKGFRNLCLRPCKNADAFQNSHYRGYFKHWINKTNKEMLRTENDEERNDLSQINPEQ
jgi:hypothetical protein